MSHDKNDEGSEVLNKRKTNKQTKQRYKRFFRYSYYTTVIAGCKSNYQTIMNTTAPLC